LCNEESIYTWKDWLDKKRPTADNLWDGLPEHVQNELAGLLWVNTLEARKREQVLITAICAHMQAVDKLEAMMAE
jgi:uncharacterized NAD(P)/FAD-binding protein YdhS